MAITKQRKQPAVGFDYDAYLRSDVWAALRRWKLDAEDHRCQVCNSDDRPQVHHRTYERIGNERENDLVVLCDDCHRQFHGITDAPRLEPDAPLPSTIPNPARWGQHAARVAELHREIRFSGEVDQGVLLRELEGIARLRRQEVLAAGAP